MAWSMVLAPASGRPAPSSWEGPPTGPSRNSQPPGRRLVHGRRPDHRALRLQGRRLRLKPRHRPDRHHPGQERTVPGHSDLRRKDLSAQHGRQGYGRNAPGPLPRRRGSNGDYTISLKCRNYIELDGTVLPTYSTAADWVKVGHDPYPWKSGRLPSNNIDSFKVALVGVYCQTKWTKTFTTPMSRQKSRQWKAR